MHGYVDTLFLFSLVVRFLIYVMPILVLWRMPTMQPFHILCAVDTFSPSTQTWTRFVSVCFVIISCYRKGDQNNLLKFAVFIHDGWRDLVLGTIESAARTYYACSLDFQMETHSASQ